MSKIVAKKYAYSLYSVMNATEAEDVFTYLRAIASLFSDSKFQDVIKSPLITKEEKAELILENLTQAPEKFVNFIKLLAEWERLQEVPEILEELDKELALRNNSYKALVESNKDLEAAKIQELNSTLSKKLGITLTTEVKNNGYDGVKVEIPDMGLRIDFSETHIKNQMLSHILKAI